MRELSEENDAHAIAAAALQIAYDQTRPDWLKADSIPEEDARNFASPKPKLRGGSSRRSNGDRNRRWGDKNGKRGNHGNGGATPKPKLKTSQRETSSSAAKESAS